MIAGVVACLRAPREADEALLSDMRHDVDLQRMLLARARPSGAAGVREWLDRRRLDSSSMLFVIADAQSNEGVGFVQVTDMDTVSGHARLGLALLAPHRGRGFGREALDLAARYLREVFSLRKAVLEVQAGNAGAISTYHAAGYTDVGIHADHFYFDGAFHDVIVMEKRL